MSVGSKCCIECRTFKPLTRFSPNRHMADGHVSKCHECINVYQAKLRAEARKKYAGVIDPQATCSKCRVEKSADRFSKDTSSKTGLFTWCKACVAEHDRMRKSRAKTLPAEIVCVRCAKTLPGTAFTKSAYTPTGRCAACRSCTKLYNRTSYRKPGATEKRIVSAKAWRAINQEKVIRYATRGNARRKALKLGNDNIFYTSQEWLDRLEEFEHCCGYCHRHESVCGTLAIEHMQPLSRSGPNVIENVIPACKLCNSRKNNMTLLEFTTAPWLYGRVLPHVAMRMAKRKTPNP